MKTELIEKLKHLKEDLVANLEYNHIITIDEAIQALTSVKSEQIPITEEHIKNAYNTTLDKLRLVKSESAENYLKNVAPFEAYGIKYYTKDEVIQAMHDFANNLEQKSIKSLEGKKANIVLWEMAKEITKLQRKAKELDTTNVMWNYLEEDWFDWLEEKFSLIANAEKKQHAIAFSRFADKNIFTENPLENYEQLYNEYLTTLNNK